MQSPCARLVLALCASRLQLYCPYRRVDLVFD
jgi:hypothetical protein